MAPDSPRSFVELCDDNEEKLQEAPPPPSDDFTTIANAFEQAPFGEVDESLLAVIELNPALASETDSSYDENTLLHLAVKHMAPPAFVKLLLKLNPAASRQRNERGDVALHLFVSQLETLADTEDERCHARCDAVFELLIEEPSVILERDGEQGCNAVHGFILLARGAQALPARFLHRMLELCPDGITATAGLQDDALDPHDLPPYHGMAALEMARSTKYRMPYEPASYDVQQTLRDAQPGSTLLQLKAAQNSIEQLTSKAAQQDKRIDELEALIRSVVP